MWFSLQSVFLLFPVKYLNIPKTKTYTGELKLYKDKRLVSFSYPIGKVCFFFKQEKKVPMTKIKPI